MNEVIRSTHIQHSQNPMGNGTTYEWQSFPGRSIYRTETESTYQVSNTK